MQFLVEGGNGNCQTESNVESIVISSANEYNLSPEDIRSNTNDETDPLQTPVAKNRKCQRMLTSKQKF